MKTIRFLFFTLVLTFISTIIPAQENTTTGRDAFLGVWILKDKTADIEIIKEGENYFIIEFVHLKHEIFFSGDETRAMFFEWGKGPSDTLILQLENNLITMLYLSEDFTWKPSSYVFYRKR